MPTIKQPTVGDLIFTALLAIYTAAIIFAFWTAFK